MNIRDKLSENTIGPRDKNSIIDFIFFFVVISVFVLFFVGQALFERDVADTKGECEVFSGNWTVTRQDGSKQEMTMPGTCEADRNELITLETKLPVKIDRDVYLCILSVKQDMKIYVGNELVQTYTTKDARLWGLASPSQYIFIGLNEEDAGKTIKIESITDSSYSGVFYTAYYGDKFEIWRHVYSKNKAELYVAIVVMIMSIFSIISGIIIRFYVRRDTQVFYLGFLGLSGSMWLLCNSVLRQQFFNNISLVNDFAFIMIMIMSLSFCLYMNVVQDKRYNRLYTAIEIIQFVGMLICSILHFFKIKDFGDTFIFVICLAASDILCFIITVLKDILSGYAKKYAITLAGIFCVFACVIIQIIIYLNRKMEFNGILIMAGLLIILLITILKTVTDLWNYQIERQKIISAGEAKAKFLANMSHEIRTPINSVMGLNEMILRESTESDIREYAVKIKNASQSLLEIINDVLDFSKIDSGKMEIVPVKFELGALLDSLCSMVSMRAENKNLRMEYHFDEKLPRKLFGDDVRLKQIILNLLTNAVKYTEKGYISFSVSGKKLEDKFLLCVSVNDTGIGIKPEDMDKLFGEFNRVDLNRNRNIEGTGLGLSITKKLLELMGSELKVKSDYGIGSEFSFEVLLDVVDDSPIGDISQYAKTAAKGYEYRTKFTAPEAKILVVDDNDINLFVFKNLIKETKIQVTTATSGKECIELSCKNEYDIIFLDHMMPEMDGIETLQKLLEMPDNLNQGKPVVALTANAIDGAKEMYLKEGFSNYISKPVIYEELELLLTKYIPEEKCRFEKTEK